MKKKTTKLYSRRDVLRLAGSTAGMAATGTLVAACAGAQPPAASAPSAPSAPTAAAPAEAAPTAAQPTPTPVVAQVYGSDSAKTTIRYWTILGSVDGIIMNDLVKKFSSENPDIRVESLQGLTEFIQKMQAATISGTAPDVAIVRHTYTGPFVLKNMLSPIEQGELDQYGIRKEDYDPIVWDFTQFDGKQYTIPLDIHAHAMLHNKKILADNGLEVPKTTDDWLNVVGKVTKDDILGYNTFALGAGAQEYLTWFWYGIQRQFGGEMLSPDGTKAAFNTPEGIAAVKWMKEMQDKGNPKNSPMMDLARTGKVATWADGPWISTLIFDKEKSPAADDIDVAVLPQHNPEKPAVWAQSHQFALPTQPNPDPAKREAVFKFIDWMTKNSIEWSKAGQIPARNSAREEMFKSDNIYLKKLQTWAKELPYLAFMPSSPKLLEVMPRIAANVEGAILGQWSVEEGLNKAESEVNKILAET
jgi:multiple sugar transport system substrate-binding protein